MAAAAQYHHIMWICFSLFPSVSSLPTPPFAIIYAKMARFKLKFNENEMICYGRDYSEGRLQITSRRMGDGEVHLGLAGMESEE